MVSLFRPSSHHWLSGSWLPTGHPQLLSSLISLYKALSIYRAGWIHPESIATPPVKIGIKAKYEPIWINRIIPAPKLTDDALLVRIITVSPDINVSLVVGHPDSGSFRSWQAVNWIGLNEIFNGWILINSFGQPPIKIKLLSQPVSPDDFTFLSLFKCFFIYFIDFVLPDPLSPKAWNQEEK